LKKKKSRTQKILMNKRDNYAMSSKNLRVLFEIITALSLKKSQYELLCIIILRVGLLIPALRGIRGLCSNEGPIHEISVNIPEFRTKVFTLLKTKEILVRFKSHALFRKYFSWYTSKIYEARTRAKMPPYFCE